MTKNELTEPIREFLRRPAPCIMATIGNHGQPVSVPCWFVLEDDDTIVLNIAEGRARIGHVEADPRVALTILGESWYQHVSLQGRVIDMHVDPDLSVIDRLSQYYTGKDYPVRDKKRVTQIFQIESVFAWGLK